MSRRTLRIAVEGCCHGMLDDIYKQLLIKQKQTGKKIDLLIICGDFQAIRNVTDLKCMSCPDKYKQIGGFHRYYTGQRKAPILTIFVGGNHEAGNHMRELYYGGWVAPNIFYMGGSSVVRFGGLRIGGVSGIFKDFDFAKGYYEQPPFRGHSRASMHHVRSFEIFKMLQVRTPLDIVISHDWPLMIERFGDTEKLLAKKPFFKAEIQKNELGSPANSLLMERLRPKWWFSAHMHVRFTAKLGPSETIYDKGWNGVPPYDNMAKNEITESTSADPAPATGAGTNNDEIAMDSLSEDETEAAPDAVPSSTEMAGSSRIRLPLNLPLPKHTEISTGAEDELASELETEEKHHTPSPPQQDDAKSEEAPEQGDEAVFEEHTFSDPRVQGRSTEFLALDKCLPRRQFLEVIDVEVTGDYDPNVKHLQLEYDPEWLAILRLCQPHVPVGETPFFPPEKAVLTGDTSPVPLFSDRLLNQELEWVNANVFADGPVFIPPNFVQIAPVPPPTTPDSAHFGLATREYGPGGRGGGGGGGSRGNRGGRGGRGGGRGHDRQGRGGNWVDSQPWQGQPPYFLYPSPQTDDFCRMLGIQNALTQRRQHDLFGTDPFTR